MKRVLLLVNLLINNIRNLFKNYIDKNYQDWDISVALRYLPIVEDIEKTYKAGEAILEVGSGIKGITPYLKKSVTGVDLNFDFDKRNSYLTPITASVLKLPFKDSSFDYVLSVDMLEHIPDIYRERAVREILRVANKKIYLSFPCGKESEKTDQALFKYYLKKKGKPHSFLAEHLDNGLPDCSKIRKYILDTSNFKIQIKGNTNILLWTFLLKMGLSDEKFKSSLYRRLLLLLPIIKHFNFLATYRKLFILERIK